MAAVRSICAVAAGAALSSPDLVIVVVIVLIPFAAVWLAALTAGLVVGFVPVAAAMGRRLMPQRSVFLQVLMGLIIAGLAVLVPVIGPGIAGLVWLTGLGAWMLLMKSSNPIRTNR